MVETFLHAPDADLLSPPAARKPSWFNIRDKVTAKINAGYEHGGHGLLQAAPGTLRYDLYEVFWEEDEA